MNNNLDQFIITCENNIIDVAEEGFGATIKKGIDWFINKLKELYHKFRDWAKNIIDKLKAIGASKRFEAALRAQSSDGKTVNMYSGFDYADIYHNITKCAFKLEDILDTAIVKIGPSIAEKIEAYVKTWNNKNFYTSKNIFGNETGKVYKKLVFANGMDADSIKDDLDRLNDLMSKGYNSSEDQMNQNPDFESDLDKYKKMDEEIKSGVIHTTFKEDISFILSDYTSFTKNARKYYNMFAQVVNRISKAIENMTKSLEELKRQNSGDTDIYTTTIERDISEGVSLITKAANFTIMPYDKYMVTVTKAKSLYATMILKYISKEEHAYKKDEDND